MNTNYLIPRV